MAKSAFMEGVRREIRLRNYSIRTEKTYLFWIKRYIRFHGLRYPREMAGEEVKSFLTWLANEQDVSANTQKTALNALSFLYQKVLAMPLGDLGFVYAKRHRRVPEVLTPNEVSLTLAQLSQPYWIIFSLLYGSGLRISECLRLRVKDIGFDDSSLTVRDGKGGKDRKTILSRQVYGFLQSSIEQGLILQQQDNLKGIGPSLPHALGRKYPNAFREPGWMFLFPSKGLCEHPVSGHICRHHLHESRPRKALKTAVVKAGIQYKRVTVTCSGILLQHICLKPVGT